MSSATAWRRFCAQVLEETGGAINMNVPSVIKGFNFYDTPQDGKVCVLRMVTGSERISRMYSCDGCGVARDGCAVYWYTFEGQVGDQNYRDMKRIITAYGEKLYLYTFDAVAKIYSWKGRVSVAFHGSKGIPDAEGKVRKAFYYFLVPDGDGLKRGQM